MVVGDIGVGALDPAGEVGADEEVEDPVDAVGGDAAALVGAHLLGDVVGGGRLVEAGERLEHGGAHLRPLLARFFHGGPGGVGEVGAGMAVVDVLHRHGFRLSQANRQARR